VNDLLGQPLTPSKKGPEKYFLKIDKVKETSAPSLTTSHGKTTKDASKKTPTKEAGKSRTEKNVLDSYQKETTNAQKEGSLLVVSHQDPSSSSPAAPQDPHTYKDIEDIVDEQEPHWRVGFVMLTIFLLILLYVKFTSFGALDTAVSLDAYLDYSSSYSQETYTVLQELLATYGDRLWISYHLVGSGEQNALASAAIACAEDQKQGTPYLQLLFSKDPTTWTSADDLLLFARDLGLDSSLFRLCMEGDVKIMLYQREVDAALAADISYTPTLVIHSKKIVGDVGAEAIQLVIDNELTALG
jgi:predicted DsbA family dithiol-disulfide isomerase